TVSDNCTPVESITLNQAPTPGTILDLGLHTVVVTATDSSGNTSSKNILVTVADTTPPTILSGPVLGTIPADQNCQARTPAVTSDIRATDNCTPPASLVISQEPAAGALVGLDRKSTRLNSSHVATSYAVFCLMNKTEST